MKFDFKLQLIGYSEENKIRKSLCDILSITLIRIKTHSYKFILIITQEIIYKYNLKKKIYHT